MRVRGRRWWVVGTAVVLVGFVLPACLPFEKRPPHARERAVVLFSPEGNRLNAYDTEPPFVKQNVIQSRAGHPEGLDINGQICFFPDGSRRFVAGEDTLQPNPPPGWGIFRLQGRTVGELSARQVGRLTPTYQGARADDGENFGCGFLSDGRILTSDVGNQATGPANGQLIVWFPPFHTGLDGTVGAVRYCKLDIEVGTAGQIYVDEQDRIYLASARTATAGVLRYSGPYPTSNTAAGGCGQTDGTGEPLADSVQRELFSGPADGVVLANGIVPSPAGGFYVSMVILGQIVEIDANGTVVRSVVEPQAGETLGSYSYGTPMGLAIDSAGTLYYADLDLRVSGVGTIGPGPDGKVWRVQFVDGEPQTPEMIDDDLRFPDGVGILEHRRMRRP